MLKLTVLQRYSENGRRICLTLGEAYVNYQKGKVNRIIGDWKTTGTFEKKFAKQKRIITKLFTSKKTLEKVFKEIRKKGLKIQRVEFDDDRYVQVVILIDE